MNKQILKIVLTLIVLLAPLASLHGAEFRLASVFTDHAVLQRETVVSVWGWAAADEEVIVTFARQKKSAKSDATGKWMVQLDPLPASMEGRELRVTAGGKSLTCSDILIGDVWLCSGQSNMVTPVKNAMDSENEILKANYPQIRLFKVKETARAKIQTQCIGNWQICSPSTAGEFSATGYFFGRELNSNLRVPIGLIQSAVGSTAAEAWTSEADLFSSTEFKTIVGKPIESSKAKVTNAGDLWANTDGDNNLPASLYNGMIAPLIPYALRGAIWYQGENNANDAVRAEAYRRLLPLMVSSWRRDFGCEFPFYIVQLANFGGRGDALIGEPWGLSLWSVLRESQALAASCLPKSGLAVAIDIGDANQIHPKNKQEVGRRLALIALDKEYGRNVECSGPVCSEMKIEGVEVVLTFTHAGGLSTKEGALTGFVIAGEDGSFEDAYAEINGKTVRVSSPMVNKPVAVRYGWSNNPKCNLVNGADLPASPFRFPLR